MKTLNDYSPMPFGRYYDHAMMIVPSEHLLELYTNNECGIGTGVKEYIEDNMDIMLKEIELKNANRRKSSRSRKVLSSALRPERKKSNQGKENIYQPVRDQPMESQYT